VAELVTDIGGLTTDSGRSGGPAKLGAPSIDLSWAGFPFGLRQAFLTDRLGAFNR
jgi:hypothetical protein